MDASDTCKTVRIRTDVTKGNPDGVTDINESDYDAKVHQLVDDGQQPSLNLTAKPPAPGPFAQQ